MRQNLPPVGADLSVWANDLRRWLARAWDNLTYKASDAKATDDGVILWDAASGYPVVSKNNKWRQIVLADGYAICGLSSDVTAASSNTAYAINWGSAIDASGITVSGDTVTFDEGGLYSISFTAQIMSSSASQVDFYFWPRINNSDVTGSAAKASLHDNGATTFVCRTSIFDLAAGDDLQAMWAVSSTNGRLKAVASTAFCPATPSVTMMISRVQA